MSTKKLTLILGDQLSLANKALSNTTTQDIIVMAEVHDEASYVRHHKHKVAMIFSAMRHFAEHLITLGYQVRYFKIGDNIRSIEQAVAQAIAEHDHNIDSIQVCHCGEYRFEQSLAALNKLKPVTFFPVVNAISSQETFNEWAKGKKQLRMEYFYRQLRRQTGVLMEGEEPVGGKWNYDANNRKRWHGEPQVPAPVEFEPDQITQQVISDVNEKFAHHPGRLDKFAWPVTKAQAEQLAEHFFTHLLPNFGDFQDAMDDSEQWLFHGRLSAAINMGLLDPLVLCQQAELAYQQNKAPLNAVEGFIRQILGWREYVRGLYWLHMPSYKNRNALAADNPLPEFFWHANTKMNCLKHAIGDTLEHGYAHHIQRLMVIGNFSLLAGLSTQEVTDWYLAIYVDAYEWVELPNTLGMALWGDGGIMASKPYCASGNYINKMSNYCKSCQFNVKKTAEADACPFNALYWHFLDKHRAKFTNNPRMALSLKNLDRKSPEELADIHQRVEEISRDLIYPTMQQ
ncbi:cryptochrome/photolyase family protein [Salinibius halmophilus]|uniref:cryptochrome/photolyase family protein n=1 Tax=Salinibius halmophilus TaxID=1853216 RepID=UPI000E671B89|nr:cryptochrome/photolyase family protein [Salinibius halmophilus]